jgi:hypothetical protein
VVIDNRELSTSGWCITWMAGMPVLSECDVTILNETQAYNGRDAFGVGASFFYDKREALNNVRRHLTRLGEQHRAAVELIGRRVLEIDAELKDAS